jgi:hypothetical protein
MSLQRVQGARAPLQQVDEGASNVALTIHCMLLLLLLSRLFFLRRWQCVDEAQRSRQGLQRLLVLLQLEQGDPLHALHDDAGDQDFLVVSLIILPIAHSCLCCREQANGILEPACHHALVSLFDGRGVIMVIHDVDLPVCVCVCVCVCVYIYIFRRRRFEEESLYREFSSSNNHHLKSPDGKKF